MKKKSGKGKPSGARAIKDLSVSAAKARQPKGGKGTPLLAAALTKGQVFKKVEIHATAT